MPRAKSVVLDFFTQISDPKYAKCVMKINHWDQLRNVNKH